MKLHRKDNLTDLVEGLPKNPRGEASSSNEPKNQEVAIAGGEVVILGHKQRLDTSPNNRTISLELSGTKGLLEILRRAFQKSFDKFLAKRKQNKDR